MSYTPVVETVHYFVKEIKCDGNGKGEGILTGSNNSGAKTCFKY